MDLRWNMRVLTEFMWLGMGTVEYCVSIALNLQVP